MTRSRWLAALVAVGLFIADRVSRTLAFNHPPQDIISGILRSDPVLNTGVALGVPIPSVLLIPLLGALIIMVVIIAYNAHRRGLLLAWWAALLVFIGAWSNLLDRFTYGAVRDFIHVSFWLSIGNLGDWMITVGAILLLVTTVRRKKPVGE